MSELTASSGMLFFRIMVGVVLPLLVALIPEQQSSNTLDPGAATDMAIAGELKMLEVCSIDLADACKSAPSAVMLFAVGRRCVPAGCFRFDASSAGATAIVEQVSGGGMRWDIYLRSTPISRALALYSTIDGLMRHLT